VGKGDKIILFPEMEAQEETGSVKVCFVLSVTLIPNEGSPQIQKKSNSAVVPDDRFLSN
jgi:hypothetical protein